MVHFAGLIGVTTLFPHPHAHRWNRAVCGWCCVTGSAPKIVSRSKALWSIWARHYQRRSLVPLPFGRLQLTSTELVFVPAPFAKPWRCSIDDILKVEEAPNPLGPFLNWLMFCFRIVLKDGTEEVFYARDFDAAMERLRKATAPSH